MLTENHIKEGLSVAYIHTVATSAGFSFSFRSVDYGIDGSINDIQIRMPEGRRFESGFGIDFQAKTSQNCIFRPSTISYDLEVKTHRDLVDSHRGRPLILIVMALPKDSMRWVSLTHKRLMLRRCAWWYYLRGQPPTARLKTVRISIPRANVFDVAAIKDLMTQVRAGVLP